MPSFNFDKRSVSRDWARNLMTQQKQRRTETFTQTVFWSFRAALTFGVSLSFKFSTLCLHFQLSLSPFFLFATDVFLEKFQKGFLVPLGRSRRLFTRSNLISSRWIWLEFKLIQYFMPVLVTCKFDDDPIKHTGAVMSTTFLSALKGR